MNAGGNYMLLSADGQPDSAVDVFLYETLHWTNDILISMDGDIYLACGEISASLVRLPTGGGSTDPKNIEWSNANA